MPTSITPEMVTKVATEGDGVFAARPYWNVKNYEFNPDGSEIWLNGKTTHRFDSLQTGKLLYLYAQNYLTPVADDTAQGILTTDATAKVELVPGTRAWRLFLMYCKAEMFSLLAGISENVNRDLHAKQAAEAWKEVFTSRAALQMAPMAGTYS